MADTSLILTHGRCPLCKGRLDACQDTATQITIHPIPLSAQDAENATDDRQPLTLTVCSDACGVLLEAHAAIGAVFLFSVSISKLQPIQTYVMENRTLIFKGVNTFKTKPVTSASQTKGKVHIEFFSPNNRVRVKDMKLAVVFNQQTRALGDDHTNPISVRQFALEEGPAAREQVRLADFFNKKQKPRFVRFTGIPTADTDLKRRLRSFPSPPPSTPTRL